MNEEILRHLMQSNELPILMCPRCECDMKRDLIRELWSCERCGLDITFDELARFGDGDD